MVGNGSSKQQFEWTFNLAQIYFRGSGVEVDYEKSANFYQKAAELGHYPSQARLGQMYINGHGVEKSRVKAYLWLSLSSQHGIGTALEALNGIVADMSAEEKAEGQQLFNTWRYRQLRKLHKWQSFQPQANNQCSVFNR